MTKKLVLILSILLALFVIPISLIAIGSNGREELPMFGDHPERRVEYYGAKLYAKWTLLTVGNKEKAFERDLRRGWIWFDEKAYRWAMKVFNRAWLLKPDDARIYAAYGALAEVSEKNAEALDWYRRGFEKGDPNAKRNLDRLSEKQ